PCGGWRPIAPSGFSKNRSAAPARCNRRQPLARRHLGASEVAFAERLMSRTLIIDDEAELDLAEAKKWYDDRREGLGDDFFGEVDAAFKTIQRMPLVPRIMIGGLRRVLVRRFPYAVFYRVTDEQLTVV